MFKYFLALIVLTHLTLYPQDNYSRIDSLLIELENEGVFSGVVSVAKLDSVLILKTMGYEDENKKSPMRQESMFDRVLNPFSINRIIILQLIQEGRLLFTDSLGNI